MRWDRTISRELVHRRALAEVWIADTAQTGVDEFLIATQLPRAHTLWSDRRNAYHDPLIAIEIGRQACLALPHLYYRVPLDWQFISRKINLRVTELAALIDDEVSPPEGVLRARFTNRWERDGALRGMHMEGELVIGGLHAAAMHGDLAFFPPEEYRRLREHVRAHKPLAGARRRIVTHPLDPARVGRLLEANVAIEGSRRTDLTPGESRFLAVIDEKHPAHFDHPQDHIPGAMLLEVYRQTAIATATGEGAAVAQRAVLTGCAVELSEFAELDAPLECAGTVIERDGDGPMGRAQLALQMYQFDTQIGAARMELTFVPARDER